MDRFWDGLKRDIQELLMHENCYSMDRLFRLACKAEHDIKRRDAGKISKRTVHIPRVESVVLTPTCEPSPPVVPTSSETDQQGNSKGTESISPHETHECRTELNMSCDEADDMITPPILEDIVDDLNLPCDQIPAIRTVLSAPLAEINSSFDLNVHNKLRVDTNGPLDLLVPPDLDHIKLIRHDDVLADISHENSLWSIKLDPPISLSHARIKIAEITWLNSVYTLDFTFNLVGVYGVDNEFLVHRICITCDDLAVLKKNSLVQMFHHFDMTSNVGVDFLANSLKHNYISKQVVASSSDTLNFYSPSLGWFNDDFCMLDYMNKSFAYICKLSCNSFMWFICCDNYLTSYFTRHDNEHRVNMSYVQQLREVKTDDIYIYHVYTLSLLLTMFQKKRRRGRLYFQERGNDMDMISVDMTNTITTSSTFDQEKDEMASGTTSIREGEDDEDIHAIDTTTTSTPTQIRGVITDRKSVV